MCKQKFKNMHTDKIRSKSSQNQRGIQAMNYCKALKLRKEDEGIKATAKSHLHVIQNPEELRKFQRGKPQTSLPANRSSTTTNEYRVRSKTPFLKERRQNAVDYSQRRKENFQKYSKAKKDKP